MSQVFKMIMTMTHRFCGFFCVVDKLTWPQVLMNVPTLTSSSAAAAITGWPNPHSAEPRSSAANVLRQANVLTPALEHAIFQEVNLETNYQSTQDSPGSVNATWLRLFLFQECHAAD